ncbi:hypothetical protein [Methylobacterium gregans]|uniref:hypothetical protein n=1 Tax=Methylobacterium gregans TaxID=374424 RepID=UPI001EE1CDBF|nr:hypothetical protein [Methylobacterium gregans]MDQ0524231.1 hypothetical protein [Methylobacterium gregans]
MAVVLEIAKNLRSRHAKIVQGRQVFLKAWLAAALRRGADRRFAEQLDQIERTGRAGAF